MKVYVVMQDVPYDSSDVVAIYATSEPAEDKASELQKENPSWNYFVVEEDVIGSPS